MSKECGCKCYQWSNEEFGNVGNKPDIEYCPTHSAAFALLEALETVATWFEHMKEDHYEKLVLHQTLETASENWDKLLQEPLNMEPILKAIAKARSKTIKTDTHQS